LGSSSLRPAVQNRLRQGSRRPPRRFAIALSEKPRRSGGAATAPWSEPSPGTAETAGLGAKHESAATPQAAGAHTSVKKNIAPQPPRTHAEEVHGGEIPAILQELRTYDEDRLVSFPVAAANTMPGINPPGAGDQVLPARPSQYEKQHGADNDPAPRGMLDAGEAHAEKHERLSQVARRRKHWPRPASHLTPPQTKAGGIVAGDISRYLLPPRRACDHAATS